MKQAVSEMEYLTTFNRSISQAMARTMQDLSEGIFINMANFTLARRDSYLDYLHAGVEQDTVNALRTSPVHLNALFPDQLITNAEEEISRNEERRSSGTSHRQQNRFRPYPASDRSTSHHDRKPTLPAWKQIKDKPGKVVARPQRSPRSRPRGSSLINDNHCVNSVTSQKNSVHVTGQGDLNPAPVVSKNSKVTLNFNVDSHVANAHIVTGLPQRKGVNPNACQLYTKIKYVKDVFCVGHLPSVNLVTNAQHAVLDPPVGARLNQCWEKWETLGSSPKVVNILREGYTLPFQFRPHLTRPTVISNYHNPTKQSFLLEALYQLINKNAVEPVENPNSLGFYNRLFLVPKPNNQWRPILDLSTLNTFLNTGSFKMETPETIRTSLQTGVGHIHRFQRCILAQIHTNSQSVQEVHAFSPPGSVLPVQSPSLWPVHSPHGVHSGGQRGQTHGTSKGYKDPPVPRRLAGESLYPRHLSPAYSNPSHTVPGARVAGEQGKIRTGPTAGLQLRRLPVRPEGGQGHTNRGTLADLDRQDQINPVGSGMPGPKIHVPHRSTHSNRKTSSLRATTHETHTVALEKQLEGPRVTRKGDAGPQIPPPPSKVVAGGKQCASRSTITPSKTCSANLNRRIKRRVGRSLRRAHCKGTVVPTREQVTHKPLGAESSISSSKRVSNPSL